MHISDVHDYNSEPAEVAQDFIDERRKEQIKGVLEQLIDDEFDRLETYANDYISDTAASRAEKFLEKVLSGDDDAAMALLGDRDNGSRYRQMGADKDSPWASLIHGSLFESGGIRLRRQIAEAHADLIRNERIADLESIVDGLTRQVQQLERQLEETRQRLG